MVRELLRGSNHYSHSGRQAFQQHIHRACIQAQVFDQHRDIMVAEDGNCFWQALSICQRQHWRHLKRQALNYMLSHPELVGGDSLQAAHEVALQARDHQWCTTAAVVAATQALDLRLLIQVESEQDAETVAVYVGDHSVPLPEVALRLRRGHYSLVDWYQGVSLAPVIGARSTLPQMIPQQPYGPDASTTTTSTTLWTHNELDDVDAKLDGGGRKNPSSTTPEGPRRGARSLTPASRVKSRSQRESLPPPSPRAGDEDRRDHTSAPSVPPPELQTVREPHLQPPVAHGDGEDQSGLRELHLCPPGTVDSVTVTVLRSSYSWHRAFQQATFGWHIVVPVTTTLGDIQQLLARQLKLRRSYLSFQMDGVMVSLDYLITAPTALTLTVDRAQDGEQEAGEGRPHDRALPAGAEGQTIAQRVHSQRQAARMRSRSGGDIGATTTSPGLPTTPSTTRPRDPPQGTTASQEKATSRASASRGRTESAKGTGSGRSSATSPAEPGLQVPPLRGRLAQQQQREVQPKQENDQQDDSCGLDLHGTDPSTSSGPTSAHPTSQERAAVQRAAVLPPHLRRSLQAAGSLFDQAYAHPRKWIRLQARNPIFLDLWVERGTEARDLTRQLGCGFYRAAHDLSPARRLREGDEVWWRVEDSPLRWVGTMQMPLSASSHQLADLNLPLSVRPQPATTRAPSLTSRIGASGQQLERGHQRQQHPPPHEQHQPHPPPDLRGGGRASDGERQANLRRATTASAQPLSDTHCTTGQAAPQGHP